MAYFLLSESGSDPVVSDVLGVKREQIEGVRSPGEHLVERLDVGENQVRALAQQFLQKQGAALETTNVTTMETIPMNPKFLSLDEATHHLYLEGQEGPIRCQVDGSLWEVWRDGRSRWIRNCEVV